MKTTSEIDDYSPINIYEFRNLTFKFGSATLSWTEKLGASRMKTSQLGADLLCQERDVHLQQNSKDKWFSYMKTGNQEQLL